MDKAENDLFGSLFPMRMTSIERFHCLDEDTKFPNLIFFRFRIDGKINSDLAKQAWQAALERQPFGDVVPERINGQWFWVSGPRAKGNRSVDAWNGARFEYQELDTPPDWNYDQHRTRSKTGSYLGISVWRTHSPRPTAADKQSQNARSRQTETDTIGFTTEVMFYVHHAIADGAAAVSVVNDWMLIYANLRSGRPVHNGIHRLDCDLFQKRNCLGLLEWRYLRHLPKQPVALYGAIKFSFRKTAELIPAVVRQQTEDPVDTSHERFPQIVGRWIDESKVKKLVEQSEIHGVMLNSVLLGQFYLALIHWRQLQGFHSDQDWIRVILPMSIRNVSDRRLPSANRATIVQIDRRKKDMADVGKLYQNLDHEIRVIRGWQLDKMFLLAIRGLAIFDTLLTRSVGNKKSRGMAVFTNLGDPLRKSVRASMREPDSTAYIRPMEIDPVGPIRKGTPVNVSISRFESRIRISMHYDASELSRDQALSLFGTYYHQLANVGESN